MRTSTLGLSGLLPLLLVAAPAHADDAAPPKPVTFTGGVTLITDYRFRGISQTEGQPAIQGTVQANTALGFYAGVWSSSIGDSYSVPTNGDVEVDLYGGYTKTFKNGVGIDGGLLYYYYPDHMSGSNTNYFEPYADLTYTIGPVSTKIGGNYVWSGQDALAAANKSDSLYLYGEAGVTIPKTPINLKGHLGRTSGSLGYFNLDPNNHTYYDWSLTGEVDGGPFKFGVSYLDTDISRQVGVYPRALEPNPVAKPYAQAYHIGSTVLAYVGVSF